MGKLLDRLLTGGHTIQDYGVISTYRQGFVHMQISALLVERKGHRRFALKRRAVAPLAVGLQYVLIEERDLGALKAAVDEAEQRFCEQQRFRQELGERFVTPGDGQHDS